MSDIISIPKFHIYCDESSQTQNRYMVIGAIYCRGDSAEKVSTTITNTMKRFNRESELKWGKIRPNNLPMYIDVYQNVSRLISNNVIHYYALVVDTHQISNHIHNGGDRELGFTKFLFTLLYKFHRISSSDKRFYTFLDSRKTKHSPDVLKLTLNSRARRDGQSSFDPYRVVEFVDSKNSRLIQLADIMSGLVAYDTNEHFVKENAAVHKIEIMRNVRELFRVQSFSQPTPYADIGSLDIWHLQL